MIILFNIKFWVGLCSVLTLVFSVLLLVFQNKSSESREKLFLLESKTLRAHFKEVGARLCDDTAAKSDLYKQTFEHLNWANKIVEENELKADEKSSIELAWKKMDSNWKILYEEKKKQDFYFNLISILTFFFAFISTILGLLSKST